MTRAIIFVHYDRDDMVDDYVYHYLKELQKNATYLVFVSTAKLVEKDIRTLSNYCSKVIIRDNIGYDFMSYKIGLESFDYQNYDEVVICNDSVYGPLYPLGSVFEKMQNNVCDFWGITDNTDFSYHIQSYFLVFKKTVITSAAFKQFWEQVEVLHDKDDIIKRYEVGLSKSLFNNGLSSTIYTEFQVSILQRVSIFVKKFTPSKILNKIIAILNKKDKIKRIGKINTTHHFWKELIVFGKTPFVKIELLRDNPMKINIHDFEHIIHEVSDYDTVLIEKHLQRVKG